MCLIAGMGYVYAFFPMYAWPMSVDPDYSSGFLGVISYPSSLV